MKFSQLNIQHYHSQLNLCHANQSPTINSLLATISKNLTHFPNLSSLSIGDIGKNSIRQLPALDTLTYLSIGTICPQATFEIIGSLDKLRTLYISLIHSSAILKLPNLLPNLFQLHIETILSNTYIELPNALSKLSRLSIGTLSNNVSLKIPNSFDNLSHITIDHIAETATLTLPDSLPNLSTFSIAGHIAILTSNTQGIKSFIFSHPTNNSLCEDLLKYINERICNPHI